MAAVPAGNGLSHGFIAGLVQISPGAVDIIDTQIQALLDHGHTFFHINRISLAVSDLGKPHGPETQGRNFDTGLAEISILHNFPFSSNRIFYAKYYRKMAKTCQLKAKQSAHGGG